MIYPVDSAIQLLNNWDQMSKNICEILTIALFLELRRKIKTYLY